MHAGESRNRSLPLQIDSVTQPAVHRLAAARLDEILAASQTAHRDVRDEPYVRIAQPHALDVLRQGDDSRADWLHRAARVGKAHAAVAEERLRYHVGLDHLLERPHWKRREEFSRVLDLFVGHLHRNAVHALAREVLARAVLEVD